MLTSILYRSVFLLILMLFCAAAFSQVNVEFTKENFKDNPDGLKDAQRNIMLGNDYYMERRSGYQVALDYYLKANSFNPDNALLNYKIGICYLNGISRDKAFDFLSKAYSLDNNVSEDIHLQLGLALHNSLKFSEAIEEYTLYRNNIKSEKQRAETEKKVDKLIEECRSGIELIANPVKAEITNIEPVNSKYPDYCPLISADESVMIFTSRREETTGKLIDDEDLGYFEDIFISKHKDGVWLQPENMKSPVNTPNHDATVGLSPDGQELYIYRGEKGGDIYVCKLKGEKWTDPRLLPQPINTEFRESSASISFDGNTLYFVSDRDANTGRDIYRSFKDKKGKWGEPEKLSSVVNTEYDEEGVFIHPDNKTLYFSSKGHRTMGGYDVFFTVLQSDGSWSVPQNIGFPINTPGDDVYFIMSANGLNGYFSSVRNEGKGDKDIYLITFTKEESPMKVASVTLVKGKILDAQTGKPVEASVEINDNTKNELVTIISSNTSTGEYLISLPSGKNYGISATANGYMFHSENFDIPDSAAFSDITLNIMLAKISVGTKIILRNIFFEYASDSITEQSTGELERVYSILAEHATMKIEISGHTDNQSSLETNIRLSQARAKSVVNYLIKKGIAPERLESKGFAYYQPVASNDTEEGRKQNRRVEFKIISK